MMESLNINQIPLSLPGEDLKLYYTFVDERPYSYNFYSLYIAHFLEKFDDSTQDEISHTNPDNKKYVLFSFYEDSLSALGTEIKNIGIALKNNDFFIITYIKQVLQKYFENLNFLIGRNFTGDIQVWEKYLTETFANIYRVWDLKIFKNEDDWLVTLGLQSQRSYIHKSNFETLAVDASLISNLTDGKKILRKKHQTIEQLKNLFPIISFKLDKKLNLGIYQTKMEFSYKRHYDLINGFYEKYLKAKELDYGLTIFSSGLKLLSSGEIMHLDSTKDLLEFGDGKLEFDTYKGFSNYGPYKLPENAQNLKFIFIFHKPNRNLANNLYKYLKYGYRHFPGLEVFGKIKFEVDTDKSIIYDDLHNPLPEIKLKLEQTTFEANTKYFALYISPISEDTEDEEDKKVYYKLKEELLKKNISSQVIEVEKITSPNVHFYLPNIAIALVAKLGGIPWKLKRDPEKYLIIGFGDYSTSDNTHIIGDTVCFNNEGVFKDLNCFEYTEANLKDSIENAIKQHIDINGTPSRLIIHYFKDWGSREERKLEEIFNSLNINIPFIVLNINDNKAQDYICFDNDYSGKIPINGTIVRLKQKEYLFFNNDRYGEGSIYKGKDKYPIKIKISSFKNFDIYDQNEIKILIDQIYQFSKLYWRSVKQKSNPVTIEYAKSLSEKVYFFESKQLPNTLVAKKTLWFI